VEVTIGLKSDLGAILDTGPWRTNAYISLPRPVEESSSSEIPGTLGYNFIVASTLTNRGRFRCSDVPTVHQASFAPFYFEEHTAYDLTSSSRWRLLPKNELDTAIALRMAGRENSKADGGQRDRELVKRH
jgi:hypothetical protein